jgi:hypothetical protein
MLDAMDKWADRASAEDVQMVASAPQPRQERSGKGPMKWEREREALTPAHLRALTVALIGGRRLAQRRGALPIEGPVPRGRGG